MRIVVVEEVEVDGRDRGVEAQNADRGSVYADGPHDAQNADRGSEDDAPMARPAGREITQPPWRPTNRGVCNRAETDPRVRALTRRDRDAFYHH